MRGKITDCLQSTTKKYKMYQIEARINAMKRANVELFDGLQRKNNYIATKEE